MNKKAPWSHWSSDELVAGGAKAAALAANNILVPF